MTRKQKRMHARLARLQASLNAEVSRGNQQAAMAIRNERELRDTLTRADQTILKLSKARVRAEHDNLHPQKIGLHVAVDTFELSADPEGVIDHTARQAAHELMEYAVKNGIVSNGAAPLPCGPKVSDFDYLSPGTAYTRPRL